MAKSDIFTAKQMAEGHGGPKARERVFIRSVYDGHRVSVALVCLASEDRTQQSFRDECDINVLMKRFEQSGVLPSARDDVPQFADVSSMSFESSMQQVAAVSGAFSMLDARTRARFGNDPSAMLDFLADPLNHAEAVKMGLMAEAKEVEHGSSQGVAGAESVGRAGSADETGGESGSAAVGAGKAASSGASDGKGAGGAEGGRPGAAALKA